MAKLEGIIYKAFGNYVVLRGFAPIGDVSEISKNQMRIKEMQMSNIKWK